MSPILEKGIKPYLFNSYDAMMRTITKFAMKSNQQERESEFKKPYLHDNYQQMEEFHQVNYKNFYNPSMDLRADVPPVISVSPECSCQGAVMKVTPEFPTVACEESISFYMAGVDGCGKKWNQSEVTWNKDMKDNRFTAPDCKRGCTHAANDSFSIIGATKCGYSSSVVTVVHPKAETGGIFGISGTENIIVGSTYTATGGKEPYTFSVSCGSINSSGVITSVTGCCGAGTVGVTDKCGQTASMVVRYAAGTWSLVSTTGSWGCQPCGACVDRSVISGSSRVISSCCNNDSYGNIGTCAEPSGGYTFLTGTKTYNWIC